MDSSTWVLLAVGAVLIFFCVLPMLLMGRKHKDTRDRDQTKKAPIDTDRPS